jgi:hypothetical protein
MRDAVISKGKVQMVTIYKRQYNAQLVAKKQRQAFRLQSSAHQIRYSLINIFIVHSTSFNYFQYFFLSINTISTIVVTCLWALMQDILLANMLYPRKQECQQTTF